MAKLENYHSLSVGGIKTRNTLLNGRHRLIGSVINVRLMFYKFIRVLTDICREGHLKDSRIKVDDVGGSFLSVQMCSNSL